VSDVSRKKVLVIDDDAAVAEVFAMTLNRAGYEAKALSSGMDASAVALQFRPDLVLCDISMPGMDGYQVLASLRAVPETRDTVFVFVTGKDNLEDVRFGMNLGADDYVSKTMSSKELLRTVAARLARREEMVTEARQHLLREPPTAEKIQRLGLSAREAEVLYWVMSGKTNPEIATILGISPGTVRTHLQNVFPRLGVETRLGAVMAVWWACGRGELG
jgi:DNA-binding NarL/FixJ family response regulator